MFDYHSFITLTLFLFQLVFQEPEDTSFFSEIISSISGIKFSNNGRYLISRDYMSIKVWDINMDKKPVETYQVHEYLRSKLCSLFESDFIFDKFECSIDGTDSWVSQASASPCSYFPFLF